MSGPEACDSFDCFGSSCSAFVIGDGHEGPAPDAVRMVRARLLGWHAGFSRFEAASELSRLNADPRTEVPVSGLMARFAQAVVTAGSLTAGLVDATLVHEIAAAGYTTDLGSPLPLSRALRLAPPRAPAAAARSRGWESIKIDVASSTVSRPPGLGLDSGGLAKGMFADVLADALAGYSSFAIDCAGDLRIGSSDGSRRQIHVAGPFDGATLYTFERANVGVATSGIGRRSWLDARGRLAHHLLDPATGRPAFTGVVQVTALAPDALTAEIRAKAAILSGPAAAASWLPDGGVIVLDDATHRVYPPPPETASAPLTREISATSGRRMRIRFPQEVPGA